MTVQNEFRFFATALYRIWLVRVQHRKLLIMFRSYEESVIVANDGQQNIGQKTKGPRAQEAQETLA